MKIKQTKSIFNEINVVCCEKNQRAKKRRANARNVRLCYPYWQYADM